jgi:hypothetical protein
VWALESVQNLSSLKELLHYRELKPVMYEQFENRVRISGVSDFRLYKDIPEIRTTFKGREHKFKDHVPVS